MADQEPGSRLKQTLAENTAQLRVLADRYANAIARATRGIEEEKEKDVPSQWKIQAWEHLRDKAENSLAKFKAGPDRLPESLRR